MEKATIYDYARMCNTNEFCSNCPMNEGDKDCYDLMREYPDKANEIILNWRKEHPVKTRQSEFLKMFPNADCLKICPKNIDKTAADINCAVSRCTNCKQEYWLAEVEEHDAK